MIRWLARKILGSPKLPPLPDVQKSPNEQKRLEREQREFEARLLALRYYRDHIADQQHHRRPG